MSKRFPCLVASYIFTASLALFGQGQGASDVIELPGQGSAQSRVVGYGAYPPQPQTDAFAFTKFLDTTVAAGTSQVIPLPDGSKFYVVCTAGVQAWNGTLTTLLHNITGVSGTVQMASVSPDGKYLVVMTTTHLYLIDTTSDTILATDPGYTGVPAGFVISHDSKIVWVLFNGIGSGLVTVSLTTHASTGLSFNPQYPVNSLAQSPKGLLYITFPGGQIDELDSTTLTLTATGLIPLTGATPGPLSFTPDGTAAYFVNQQPTADQGSLLKLNLTTHTVTSWPTSGPTPTFSQVIIAGNSKIFAYSPADNTLWDVTPSPLSAAQSTVTMAFPTNHVLSVAVSDEVPSARFLFAQVDDIVRRDLYRIDLSNGNLNALASFSLDPATLQFVGTPAQSGATGFTQLNAIQVVNQGATSLPLIARVLNSIARPVANQIVSFTVDPASGIILANPSQITGSDGWVQTTLTAPSTAGTYTVTLTAGLVSTTFTIVVPGPGGGQSLSVVGGNGQLLPELAATSLTSPLAVLAQDILGNPLSGIDVTFTVSDGPGHMESADIITDENGIAVDRFDSGLLSTLSSGLAFQTSTISATSSAGSTTLVATTFHQNLDGTGQPIVTVVTPNTLQLTIGQGDVLAGGITTSSIGNNGFQVGQGIPNVGLRIGAWPDATMKGPLSCKGSSLSDNLGMSTCNVQAACQMGSFDTTLAIGEFRAFRVTATITSGHPQALTMISGNNQSGHPGDVTVPLVAKLTDGCNQPIAGTLVVWSITQGSGTLTQVQSLSAGDGTVSARVTLGQIVGPITVQVALAGLTPVVFQLSDVAVISGISVVSGASQSVQVGQVFANPVIFVVRDTSNNPVQGIPVVFTVTGTSMVNPLSAITDVQGRVQASVTAGNAAGPVIVTATITNFSITAILTVRPPGPQVSVNSFVNAGSYIGGLTPCGLVAAFGAGLAPNIPGVVLLGNPSAPLGPWPFTLNQLTITVNGINAPIQAVANANGEEQVNFQVPCEVSVGPATMVVTYNGSSTTVTGVPVTAAQPGIFAFRGTNGSFYAGVIRGLDGTYVTQTNFAHRGETYYLLLTGLGQTNPVAVTNTLGVANQNVIATIAMVINVGGVNTGVPIVSARYLQSAAGVYVVGFTIPSGFGTGTDLPIDISAFVNGQNVFGGSHLLLPGIN